MTATLTATARKKDVFQSAMDRLATRQQAAREKALPIYHALVHRFAKGEDVAEELSAAAAKAGKTQADIRVAMESIARRNFLEEKMLKMYGPDWRNKSRELDAERHRLAREREEINRRAWELGLEWQKANNACDWVNAYLRECKSFDNDPLFSNVGSGS